MTHRKRTHLFLSLAAVVAILIAAVAYKGEVLLEKLINHGDLVKPPFAVSLLPIQNEHGEKLSTTTRNKINKPGKWILVYFNPGLCEDDCQKGLLTLEQVCKTADKNNERIDNILLTYPGHEANTIALDLLLKARFPKTQLLTTTPEPFDTVVRTHIRHNKTLESGSVLLINPRGNVVMTYAPHANPEGIYKDIRKYSRTH